MNYRERIESLIALILSTLDESLSGEAMAEQTRLSRFQLCRQFRKITGETPAKFRRRLLLERAAYQLTDTDTSVTDIAFDAGFEALEAFTRAFGKAYGFSPSRYRRLGVRAYQLGAPSGVHFVPERGKAMDLLDHLLEHDVWLTRRMLERAQVLSDVQLDQPLAAHTPLSFEPPQKSLREMFHRQVFWKEVWVAVIKRSTFAEEADKSVSGMLARLEYAFPEFKDLAKKVNAEGRWEESFVDELCTPPETFTYGGVLAHVITYSAHQRLVILDVLRRFGIQDLGSGDPMEYRGYIGQKEHAST